MPAASLSSLSSLTLLPLLSSLFVSSVAASCTLTYPLRNCTFHTISDCAVDIAQAMSTADYSLSHCDREYCAPTTSRFQIYSQYFGPDPPVADQNVTMWIEYAVPSSLTVAGGKSQDSVTLNGLPVSTETSDLCNSVVCPVTAGMHNTTNSFVWPAGITSGSRVTYTTKWFDEQNTLLLCSKATVTTV
jgi:hypothetical protein